MKLVINNKFIARVIILILPLTLMYFSKKYLIWEGWGDDKFALPEGGYVLSWILVTIISLVYIINFLSDLYEGNVKMRFEIDLLNPFKKRRHNG